jgi:hypothetical protein
VKSPADPDKLAFLVGKARLMSGSTGDVDTESKLHVLSLR